MKITAIKTVKIRPHKSNIFMILDKFVPSMSEGDIFAITSKIVSLCENNVVPIGTVDKNDLVKQEADYFLSNKHSKYGHHFTITQNTLIASAGIDESNGDNNYVLWPKDSQQTANKIRQYLSKRFKIKNVGVIITDSTCQPLRLGTTGIVLAHSGFTALTDYVGMPDLFGKPFNVTRANIAGGLAAAAVLVMGEGAEQTPLCILSELPSFIGYQNHNPKISDLEYRTIPVEDDLFEPFIGSVNWKKAKKQACPGKAPKKCQSRAC